MNPSNTYQLSPAAIAALEDGKIIDAIKIVREATGLGLKDAKDLVEAYQKNQPFSIPQSAAVAAKNNGILLPVIVLALAAILLTWLIWK